MAAWTYETALERGVFPHEGGYTNHPADPGGPTNWGITIADARAYWKKDATADDVKAMPKSVAQEIYRKHYAEPLRYDDLPAGVDYAVLDYGINSGISRAAKVLQRLCRVTPDGQIGPVTLAAVKDKPAGSLVQSICDERLQFLRSLRTWSVFGRGWSARVADVRDLARSFVIAPGIVSPVLGKAVEPLELPIANVPPEGFAVSVAGDKIAILDFERELSRQQALNLAAWLVAMADPKGDDFKAYLDAVRNT